MHIRFGGATVQLMEVGEHGFLLSNLYSQRRGEGHASNVMRLAMEIADDQQREIVLWVGQFGDVHGMTNPELEAWYGRLGFVKMLDISGRAMMIRKPREKNTSYNETPV